MAFFCPNCNYDLGISKKTDLKDDDDKQEITLEEIFKKLSKKEKLSKYIPNFKKSDLETNKKYLKLPSSDKKKLDSLFVNKLLEAELSCQNCGYSKVLEETIKLYEYNVNDTNYSKTLDDNKLLCLDPTLPRTRDFTCKNSSCPTLKGGTKEAVFMRIPKSYNLTYICTTCYHSWNIV